MDQTPPSPQPPSAPDLASRRATLRTIAERAGVSVSTVSRVLNAGPHEASRAASGTTIERIRAIAAELSYVPDPAGTSLRTQRTRLVGVLVPRLSDIVLATIYEGIEETAAAMGYQTVVLNTRDVPAEQRIRAETLLARRAEGLILGDVRSDGGLVDALAARDVPFVLVSRRSGSHPSVTCDDVTGGRLVADHLLDLGHRNVAVIAGEPYASTGIDRTAGFVQRLRERGVTPAAVVHSSFDARGGHVAASGLLSGPGRPSAIFAVNDFAAIGVMGAARESGLEVGRDVSVVGFNDVSIAVELPVPLTTVASPMHAMGSRAMDLLALRMQGVEVTAELLPAVLRARASTGPPSSASTRG